MHVCVGGLFQGASRTFLNRAAEAGGPKGDQRGPAEGTRSPKEPIWGSECSKKAKDGARGAQAEPAEPIGTHRNQSSTEGTKGAERGPGAQGVPEEARGSQREPGEPKEPKGPRGNQREPEGTKACMSQRYDKPCISQYKLLRGETATCWPSCVFCCPRMSSFWSHLGVHFNFWGTKSGSERKQSDCDTIFVDF